MASIFVINSRGEKEPFSKSKIYRSAKMAGASSDVAWKIARTVKKEACPGIKTSAISARAEQLLRKDFPGVAFRFNIKKAMRDLGPTGFPFEKYIKNILKTWGYEASINQFLPGKCLSAYEIDFVAKKGNVIYIGECKYKHRFGDRIHYYDALANHARFLDILEGGSYHNFKIKSMLVTNTKFSDRTRDYCRCVGTELLGWNYPENRGLEYFIEKEKLYPITILPSLKGHLKDIMVREKIMLADHILKIDMRKFAEKHKLPPRQLARLVQQAETLLK